jgi:beta-glucosidase
MHPETSTSSLNPVYKDPTRPIEERVDDLISRMTLEEKISQMVHGAPAIERLDVPEYNWWSECLHGVGRAGIATVFPQAIGLAATWNADLMYRIATAISDEARAKYHDALRKGIHKQYFGLTFWSPNVNIFRDPRWGRGQETWGEDPFLTGEMGAAFVRGLQGDHPKYMKAAACAKHYTVHSGPEKDRHTFNAVVSKRDLYATYLPAFKKLVTEAKVEAVMGAYNRLLGEPCCASKLLLVDILRGQWGFQGHVVSDCWALNDIHDNHKVTQDAAESAALALKAGCDIECGATYAYLGEAIERGLITEADIDRSLARTLTTRFKLGMFDPPSEVPYASIPMRVVGCEAHRQLAYEAAVKSVVLLKNQDNILPIRDTARSLFVTGPCAANVDVLLGSYHGVSSTLTTLLEGIVRGAPEGVKVAYRHGCALTQPTASLVNWAVSEAADSDLTIACMGTSPLMEGEQGESILSAQEGDRSDITLPDSQVAYVKEIAARGAKIVLVLTGGSPIALGELADLVQAVVFVWYPGQEGGKAVADVLFGQAAPSGKLPLTFPKSLDDLPPFEDYNMTGRTYRYSTAEPLYPFGFGLSYTQFAYSGLTLAKETVKAGETLPVRFTLTNTGQVDAEEVAQVYLSDLEASVPVPIHSLIGFQRVRLAPGESKTIEFTISPEMMMLFDDDGKQKLEPGQFRLTVGGCSPGARGVALGAPQPVSAVFAVAQ